MLVDHDGRVRMHDSDTRKKRAKGLYVIAEAVGTEGTLEVRALPLDGPAVTSTTPAPRPAPPSTLQRFLNTHLPSWEVFFSVEGREHLRRLETRIDIDERQAERG